jgi:hypothetical protein
MCEDEASSPRDGESACDVSAFEKSCSLISFVVVLEAVVASFCKDVDVDSKAAVKSGR